MSLKPYPQYKESGVEWLGVIPASWDVKPLFAVASENRRPNKGLVESNLLSLSYGNIVKKDMSSNDGLLPESFETYQVIERDDMLFRLTDLQNDKRSLRSALVFERGIITSAYLSVAPTAIVPRFFAYAMRDADLRKVFYSMGGGLRQSMKYDDMKRLSIVCPSLHEQNTIADFLDHETGEIDEFIADQEELIVLLNERRAATITQAVTKGLDPTVPMKDSGVEWLRAIPESWDVAKLGWYSSCNSGKSISADDVVVVDDSEHKYPVMGGNGSVGFAESFNVSASVLVIGRVGALCGNVHLVTDPAWVTDNALRLTVTKKYALQYLAHLLRSRDLNSLADKTAQPLITGTLVSRQRLPLPPVETQIEIAEFLKNETTEIDAAMDDARQAVAFSKERRAALISAAVTGKIDVRETSASKQPLLEGDPVGAA